MTDDRKESDLMAWLAQVPCFARLREGERQALVAASRRRLFRRGDRLFEQDSPGHTLYVVRRGRVKIVHFTPNGQETLLRVARPGECLGEMALLDDEPRSATAVALETVETLAFPRDQVHALLERMPALALALACELAERVRHLDERLQEALWQDVSRRIARALLMLAEQHGRPTPAGIRVHLALTHEEWGHLVGAVRQSVNKVLSGLQKCGIVSMDRRGFILHQPDALRAWLEQS
jgi:CRP/FNR family cyclic AMP-dependent transcriptional regulator